MRHARVTTRRNTSQNLMRACMALLLAIVGLFAGTMIAQQTRPEIDRYTFEKISPPPPATSTSVGVIEGRWCLDTDGPCAVYFADES